MISDADVLSRLDKVRAAAAAADRAVTLAEPLAHDDPAYLFDLACAYALQARLDPAAPRPPADAVKALEAAVKEGFDNAYKLETDERLAPLRSREDYRALIRLVKDRPATSAGTRGVP